MGVFQNNLMGAAAAAASAGGDFYDHQIANSIRADTNDGYLHRTPSGAGNRATWTFSTWIKLAQMGTGTRHIYSAGSSGDQDGFYRLFYNANKLIVSSANANFLTPDNLFRDPSAWYNIVWKQGSNASTLYVNGSQIATASVSGNTAVNNNTLQCIGTSSFGGSPTNSEHLDGYFAETIMIDGTALDADSFGETKNGVWIPKDASGLTFGTNGFHLKYESSSDLGNDSSGNNNDWTAVNLAAHDQMLDTPTFGSSNGGNFPTYNPLLKPPTGLALAEGNLKATLTSDDNGIMTNWQVPVTGKWYWEVDVDNIATDHGVYVGVMPANTDLTINQEQNDLGLVYYSINGNSILKGTRSSYGATWTTGDIISIAVDRDADTLQFYKNGAGQGTISISSLDEEFFCYMGYTGGSGPCSTILNFGQDGTFAGNVTAGGNSDGTGYGNFKYSVPSGFLAICSGNQPLADAINPAETDDNYPQKLFNNVLYTGNGSTNNITGVGFQPDLTWIKIRNTPSNGPLVDSTRGTNKVIFSQITDAEVTSANLTSFDSDGFSLAGGLASYDANFNGNTNTYVAWNWRVNGGTTSTNSNGSTNSTVQVDPSGHFSIVKFEGQNDSWGNAETIGHGLSSAPTCMILKNYDKADQWSVFFSDYGNASIGGSNAASNELVLNTNAALYTNQSYKGWGGVMPTSTVFTVDGNNNNGSGESIVVYCFANCEGYIKSGAYEGNGNADGTFIHTGFRPALVTTKRTDGSGGWLVHDNARNTYNPANLIVQWNDHGAEFSGANDKVDMLSNGFKVRSSNAGINGSGNDYVYIAMAKNPFKYATAR